MTSKRQAAAFLDRDGVINIDHGYVHKISQLNWVPGAVDAIKNLKNAGYLVVVVTNQAGIAKGLYDESDMETLHAHISLTLQNQGAYIDRFYHCPFHAEAITSRYRHKNHPDRKPNPGMINRAIRDLDIDATRSFLIGDKQSDIIAARRALIPGYLFKSGRLDTKVEDVLKHFAERQLGTNSPSK